MFCKRVNTGFKKERPRICKNKNEKKKKRQNQIDQISTSVPPGFEFCLLTGDAIQHQLMLALNIVDCSLKASLHDGGVDV